LQGSMVWACSASSIISRSERRNVMFGGGPGYRGLAERHRNQAQLFLEATCVAGSSTAASRRPFCYGNRRRRRSQSRYGLLYGCRTHGRVGCNGCLCGISSICRRRQERWERGHTDVASAARRGSISRLPRNFFGSPECVYRDDGQRNLADLHRHQRNPGRPAQRHALSVKNLRDQERSACWLTATYSRTWQASQKGHKSCSPEESGRGASWVVVRDITLSNNIIRHAAGGINILGQIDHPSQRTSNIAIRTILLDIGSARRTTLPITSSPAGVKLTTTRFSKTA
jgi:hypothetical protein